MRAEKNFAEDSTAINENGLISVRPAVAGAGAVNDDIDGWNVVFYGLQIIDGGQIGLVRGQFSSAI